jgi:hypothetical protein
MTDRRPDWRDLCAAIAVEKDPNKVLELSTQLLDILDAHESRRVVARSNGGSSDSPDETMQGGFTGQKEG